MNSTSPCLYKPSGKIGPFTILYLCIACGAAIGIAWIYQWVCSWNEGLGDTNLPGLGSRYAYIALWAMEAVAFMGMTFGIGLLTALTVGFGNCRNRVVAAVIGLAIATVTIVAGHHLASLHWSGKEVKTEGFWPNLREYFQMRANKGHPALTYRTKVIYGDRVDGMAIYAWYGLGFFLACIGGAVGGILTASEPFDELTGEWVLKKKTLTTVSTSRVEFERIANADTLYQLLRLPTKCTDSNAPIKISYALAVPAGPPTLSYLTINSQEFRIESGRRNRLHWEEVLWKNVILSESDVTVLLAAINEHQEPTTE